MFLLIVHSHFICRLLRIKSQKLKAPTLTFELHVLASDKAAKWILISAHKSPLLFYAAK